MAASEAHLARPFREELFRVLASPLFQFLAATAVAFVVFFARAPAAYLSPVLFAEDQSWTSMVVTRGFWDTALHAREDYCILGNVILVWLGLQACEWFCGGDVLMLPQCLAVVSYLFFAAAVSLPILLLGRQLPATYRWLAWALACLLPLGIHAPCWSGFEILGRTVNVGYVFLFIAFVLLWHRTTAVRTLWQALPVDAALLVCTATNPFCILMLPAAAWPAARRWLVAGESPATIFREGACASLLLLVVACLAVNGLPSARAPHLGAASPPVSLDAAVEMGVARGLLYPFVWPIYHRLSTGSTLAIAAAAAVVCWRFGQPRHRAVMMAGVGTVAIVSAVLVLRRGELAAFLDGYRSTFPDRYYMGQNLVVVVLLVVFAADVAERLRGRGWLAALPAVALGCLALGAAGHEPIWKLAASQFLVVDGGMLEATAARAMRDQCFVDAAGRPDASGEFVQMVSSPQSCLPLILPRRTVARSLAVRADHRSRLAMRTDPLRR
jgi:hypothetical protein